MPSAHWSQIKTAPKDQRILLWDKNEKRWYVAMWVDTTRTVEVMVSRKGNRTTYETQV